MPHDLHRDLSLTDIIILKPFLATPVLGECTIQFVRDPNNFSVFSHHFTIYTVFYEKFLLSLSKYVAGVEEDL